jgi:N-acetylglucosaminyl-diphospho-decaprenol L-rhamnosyltransferase
MFKEDSLSIIIVNWNSKEFLRKCLASLYANARGSSWEVLVVDNASFDGCGEMISREFPGVRFLQSQENMGFAKANNLGVAHSKGCNLLFLNPDTEVIGPAIQTMLSALESSEDAGIIGCTLLCSDLSIDGDSPQAFPSILNQAFDLSVLRAWFPRLALWGNRVLFENRGGAASVDVLSGACLMIKRSVFEAVGQFSTRYFMYSEDVDLCYKVKRAGWKNYFTGAAQVIHRGGKSSKSQTEHHFAAVKTRESLALYMRDTHGRFYASAYQASTALVAMLRLLILSGIFALTLGQFRRHRLLQAFGKWITIFRWAVGLDTSKNALA